MEKKTPSPFKRDIDRAYKRLQLASMVLGNVSEAYDTGDLKEAYRTLSSSHTTRNGSHCSQGRFLL